MKRVSETKQLLETGVKDAPVKDILWNAQEAEVKGDVNLQEDPGQGGAAIIRMFEFRANPEAFKIHKPTKQELFNSHLKGIEILLWQDGMKIMTTVAPRININKKQTKYRIFVGASPQKGYILTEKPQLLREIIK